jgi:hypothetical protein
MQATVRSAQCAHDLVERLEIARDHSAMADFSRAQDFGER